MKMEKIIWITVGILILITLGIFIYCNNNKPECYLTEERECMYGYDKMLLQYQTEYGFSYQCCKKPHYLLQTLEHKLINHGVELNINSENEKENENKEI